MKLKERAQAGAIAVPHNVARLSDATTMRINLLKDLLRVPTCSGKEDEMVEFVVDHVRQGGVGLRGTWSTDEWHNVYIRKGSAEWSPLIAAHIDTVHARRAVEIIQQDGILFGLDPQGHRAGIGADDKVGIFVCLELLENFENIAVALFGSEEVGCVGARHAPDAWFKDVGYVVEFDAPAQGLVSKSCGGVPLFADGGEFITAAAPVLHQHGFAEWGHHPFTDVMVLRQRFEFSCLNVSCGYHNWHQPTEYVVIDEVEAALKLGMDLVRSLGCHRFPYDPASFSSQSQPTGAPSRQPH